MPNQEVKNEKGNDPSTNLYKEQNLVKPEEPLSEVRVTLPETTKPKLVKGKIYEGEVIGRNRKDFLTVKYLGCTFTVYDPNNPGSYVPSFYDYKIGTTVGFRLISDPDRGVLWGELLYKKKQK